MEDRREARGKVTGRGRVGRSGENWGEGGGGCSLLVLCRLSGQSSSTGAKTTFVFPGDWLDLIR